MSFLKRWRSGRAQGGELSDAELKSSGNSSNSNKKNGNAFGLHGGNSHAKKCVKSFNIELKGDKEFWKPNDSICGEILLKLSQDMINVKIRLSLVCVISTGNGKMGSHKSLGSDVFFEKSRCIYGDESVTSTDQEKSVDSVDEKEINGLSKGEHRFPVRLKVPGTDKMFDSITFEKSSLMYFLKGELLEFYSKREISHCRREICIVVPFDVAPYAASRSKSLVLQSVTPASSSVRNTKVSEDSSSSIQTKLSKNSSSSNKSEATSKLTDNNKTVKITVSTAHSGYIVGELIPIKFTIQHYKNYSHPAGLIITLVRICRIHDSTKDNTLETYRKDICQTVSPIYTSQETHEATVTSFLKVPLDALSTFTKLPQYFTFQYYIEVLVNLSTRNIVYTESNRVVGTSTDSAMTHDATKSRVLENFQNLQNRLANMVTLDSNHIDVSELESTILYHDLINVKRLKKLPNVTGLSLETIVGSFRSEPKLTEKESLVEQGNLSSPINDDWEQAATSDVIKQPNPACYSNSNIMSSDDMKELEKARLKQLESDPPEDPFY